METLVGSFRLDRKIQSGAQGEVYRATSIRTGEKVAIKLESTRSKNPRLKYEAKLYKLLQGGRGIPRVHWDGVSGSHTALALDLLGLDLEELFTHCRRKFSLKCVLMLADQMLERVEYLHERGYVHRDLKPENFCVGPRGKENEIYLIDLGLAKAYRDPETREHVPCQSQQRFAGTMCFATASAHRNESQSRRDDLESLGYILVYFLSGALPWERLEGSSKAHELHAIMKAKTKPEQLCHGLPGEFAAYIKYCRSLNFCDDPDYSYLRRLFKDVYRREAYKEDLLFDWQLSSGRPLSSRPRSSSRRGRSGRADSHDYDWLCGLGGA